MVRPTPQSGMALEGAAKRHRVELLRVDGDDGSRPSVVYCCNHNGGLGNCLLLFLGLAQQAEAAGYAAVYFDGQAMLMYCDISMLFRQLPEGCKCNAEGAL